MVKEEIKKEEIKKEEDKPNYKLLFSTSTFIFPMLYTYQKNKYLFFASSIALFGSLNHWRNPKIGCRRNIDLVTSNIALVTYIYHGYNSVIGIYPKLFIWNNLFLMIYFYSNSYNKFYLQNKNWVYYHMLFHFIVTTSQTFIIYCV